MNARDGSAVEVAVAPSAQETLAREVLGLFVPKRSGHHEDVDNSSLALMGRMSSVQVGRYLLGNTEAPKVHEVVRPLLTKMTQGLDFPGMFFALDAYEYYGDQPLRASFSAFPELTLIVLGHEEGKIVIHFQEKSVRPTLSLAIPDSVLKDEEILVPHKIEADRILAINAEQAKRNAVATFGQSYPGLSGRRHAGTAYNPPSRNLR